jgi:hypothetical protein
MMQSFTRSMCLKKSRLSLHGIEVCQMHSKSQQLFL